MSEIADRYGVNWRALARANNISDPRRLRPGMRLVIPGNSAAASSAASRADESSRTSDTSSVATVGTVIPPGELDARIDHLIDTTAKHESNMRYDRINPNDNGKGISFGLIQFNQKAGALPDLLKEMYRANPRKFREIFGRYSDRMLNTRWVKRARLNTRTFREMFKKAGRVPEFQKVQRKLARKGYFDKALEVAKKYGIRTERGLSILFDTAVQGGANGLEDRVRRAVRDFGRPGETISEKEFLRLFAKRMDRVLELSNGRRTRLYNSPHLSDTLLYW